MSYMELYYLTKGSELPKAQFFRVMYPDMLHRGFQWRLGENTDMLPFMPQGRCHPGGLYFTTFDKLMDFFVVRNGTVKLLDHWLAEVTVAPDEPVWCEQHVVWKAHRVTVSSLTRIGDLDVRTRLQMFHRYTPLVADDVQLWKMVLREDFKTLMMLEPEQETAELVKFALDANPGALQFVHNQTFDVCCYAVNIDEDMDGYIRDPHMAQRVGNWMLENGIVSDEE